MVHEGHEQEDEEIHLDDMDTHQEDLPEWIVRLDHYLNSDDDLKKLMTTAVRSTNMKDRTRVFTWRDLGLGVDDFAQARLRIFPHGKKFSKKSEITNFLLSSDQVDNGNTKDMVYPAVVETINRLQMCYDQHQHLASDHPSLPPDNTDRISCLALIGNIRFDPLTNPEGVTRGVEVFFSCTMLMQIDTELYLPKEARNGYLLMDPSQISSDLKGCISRHLGDNKSYMPQIDVVSHVGNLSSECEHLDRLPELYAELEKLEELYQKAGKPSGEPYKENLSLQIKDIKCLLTAQWTTTLAELNSYLDVEKKRRVLVTNRILQMLKDYCGSDNFETDCTKDAFPMSMKIYIHYPPPSFDREKLLMTFRDVWVRISAGPSRLQLEKER